MERLRPRRSALYMPGSNARALEKAKTLPADALIFDLEDAVAPDVKETARDQVMAAVGSKSYGPREVVVRVNGLSTPWGADDLRAAAAAGPDAVLIPKPTSAQDVMDAEAVLNEAGAPPEVRLWAMMETPMAVLDPLAIARAALEPGSRLVCFVMGTNDIAKDTRMRLLPGRAAMMGWLANCVAAARVVGIDILDGVFNDFRNEGGFRDECLQGRDIGMDGKTLIHPNQVPICNIAFSPTTTEVEEARRIIEAFALPENQGLAAISVDGRMVELLHAEIARRTVALSNAIAGRG